jgi:hypothetical protein
MMPAKSASVVGCVKRLLGFGDRERPDVSEALNLLRLAEERSRTLESLLHDSLMLLRITEERSRTDLYQSTQALFYANYQMDMLQNWYVESMLASSHLANNRAVVAARSIRLKTDHPLALTSNDHLAPDSTAEGIVRPTKFVRHCVDVLGSDIRCLDLGTGAAGLVLEYVMNGIVAIGVDGSDYCRKNKIGYWPLLPDNLRTCDITRPFLFEQANEETAHFNLITMWEVLEHIGEDDLPGLLQNVKLHLASTGYFVGSISLVEYADKEGAPYHVTLKPKDWWRERFEENGLVMLDEHPFNERLFCRGNGPRFQDFHNYSSTPGEGFHFVARLHPNDLRDCE